jgi:hypothetical protein
VKIVGVLLPKITIRKRRVAFFRKKMEMPFDPFFSPLAFRKKQ